MTDSPVVASGSLRWWDQLPRWQKIASSAVALIAMIVVYLRFFAPFETVDLTVWIRQRIAVALPTSATDSLPLRLTLGHDTIQRANLLDVEIANTGKTALGSDTD